MFLGSVMLFGCGGGCGGGGGIGSVVALITRFFVASYYYLVSLNLIMVVMSVDCV